MWGRGSGWKTLSRVAAVLGLCLASSSAALAQHMQFPQGEFPLTDFDRASVRIDEIMSGGPPRDGIPAIDKPQFVSVDEASEWLNDREPVIALTINNTSRAYPLQILMYHEIVNDELAGKPVAVTFCPLCNASIVFERQVGEGDDKRLLDFGTTGRLRNSDLVMYDRQTESWWQQFTGRGIIGEYTDKTLPRLPSLIISFEAFKAAYPKSDVLSPNTGFTRPYGNNPYRGYDAIDSNPFLYDGKIDPRLPPMERVLSIRSDGQTQLIPLQALQQTPLLNLMLDAEPVAVFAASTVASALDAGRIAESRAIPAAAAYHAIVDNEPLSFVLEGNVIKDKQTGSEWNAFGKSTRGQLMGEQLQQLDEGVHFAFAWLAFDPDAEIVDVK